MATLIGLPVLIACDGAQPNSGDRFESEQVSEEVENYINGLAAELRDTREQVRVLNEKVNSLESELSETKKTQARLLSNQAKHMAPGSVDLQGTSLLGDSEARIAIIEFTDYECPFCRRHLQQTLPQIKANFIDTGLVRYGIKDYPLSSHANARPAAIAARCAENQGNYWEMHAALFDNRDDLGPRLYQKLANKLDLDIDKFETCLNDPAVAEGVDDDKAYGKELLVRGTPKFFIGRIEGDAIVDVMTIDGARPYEDFVAAVKQLQ